MIEFTNSLTVTLHGKYLPSIRVVKKARVLF